MEEVIKILKDYYNMKYKRFEDVELALKEVSKNELIDFILSAQSRRNLELMGIYQEED